MKNFLLLTLFIFSAILTYGQENKTKQKNPYDVNFHVVTQSEPSYPAGDKVLFTYFADSIKYSDEAKAKGISGNVLVSFNVMPDSTLSDVFVLSGVGYGIDDEVVKLLTPLKYAPGIQSGEKTKMNVILTVPVKAQ